MKFKTIFLFPFILLASFVVQAKSFRVGVLSGPSGIPCCYLMENATHISGYDIEYQVFANAQQMVPKLVKGELDAGFLPPNVAAKIYNTSGTVQVGAVTGKGMLSVITKDSSVKSLKDLKGKRVLVAGHGATPEYMFRFLLEKNKIKVDCKKGSVYMDFSVPNNAIAGMLIAGKADCALVPEPFATVACSKDSSVRKAVDIQAEYRKVLRKKPDENFPMTVLVINREFVEKDFDFVADFRPAVEGAIIWTNENPGLAAELVAKSDIGLDISTARNVIPACAFDYDSAQESKSQLEELFRLYMEYSPESIGGRLPGMGFYVK